MIEFTKGDYLIVKFEGKSKLILATSLSGDIGKGFLEETESEEERTVNFGTEFIVANLGREPVPGSVYGVKVEPLLKAMEAPDWGELAIYRKLEVEERKVLGASLKRVYKSLDKQGLSYFMPLRLEIRQKNGKYAGYYKLRKNKPPIMCLKPPTFHLSNDEIDALLYHESGHGLFMHSSFPQQLKATWIKLFQKRVLCKGVKQDALDQILDAIYDYSGSIKDFYKDEASDDTQVILRECLSHIKRVRRLDAEKLDILLLQRGRGSLDKIWPKYTDLTSTFEDVSSYSMTNADEFFAEAMMFSQMKVELPKDIEKLMKETLSEIRD